TSILAIQNMVQDSARLARAASQGDIQARANEQNHNGEFLSIVKGINSTLDAISAPLGECITVMHSLSEGNLSQQIQGNYEGQFNELKRSVNTSVSNLSNMVSEITSTTLTITGSS
ncbi:diguanylate cyclase, partial [Tenacibaculum discolor]